MGGREVLELVDEDVAVLGLHRAAQLAVLEERLERAEDLLVVVDDAPAAELVAVGLVGGGQTGDVVEGVLHLLRVGAGPSRMSESPSMYGRDRVGVHPPLLGGDEALDDRPHLALVEQLGPAAQGAAEDAVAPGVERLDARAEARAAAPPSPPGPSCCRRAPRTPRARSRGRRAGGGSAR